MYGLVKMLSRRRLLWLLLGFILLLSSAFFYHPLYRAYEVLLMLGDIGNASVVKVVTNMLAFIHLVAAGEGMMLAAKQGVDLGAAYRAIQASSGNSFVHETESQLILNGSYNINFTMDLACKDLGFADQIADKLGIPLELGSVTRQIFRRACNLYGGDAWSPQVVKMLEDACGQTLRAPGFPETLVAE